MSYKLNEKGQEVLSDIPVEGFVSDLKVDPLERVKMDIIRAVVSKMDNSVETDEDRLDYDIEDKDDLDFGLTDYEHYAKMLDDYDRKKDFDDAPNSGPVDSDSISQSDDDSSTSSDSSSKKDI